MVDFKRVNAEDNKDHEKVEAERRDQRNAERAKTGESHPEMQASQGKRDSAELARQNAASGAAAHTDGNRDAVDAAAKLGGGPAGLNQGPSDTVSADPHNPRNNAPIYGGSGQASGGMGTSPPQGGASMSDKPNLRNPEEDRANQRGGDDAAKEAAEKSRDERKRSEDDERKAKAAISDAEREIADQQPKAAETQAQREDREKRERSQF